MIDWKIKQLIFDRQAVIAAVDKAQRAVLARAGAFIRTAARTSIRARTGTSPPGSPPYSHVGLLRRLILFGYDRARESVVVGPVKLHKPGDAPHVLEFGGTTTLERRGRGRRGRRGGRGGRLERRAHVRARPYMGPALQKEKRTLPALWAGSVRGG